MMEKPAKKPKLTSDEIPQEKWKSADDGPNHLTRKEGENEDFVIIKIEPILDTEYTRGVELTSVYVGDIEDKKNASSVVKYLSSTFPLSNFQHLKRIKANTVKFEPMSVIVCPVSYFQEPCSETDVVNHLGTVSGMVKNIKIQSVPKYAPRTRQQYDDSSRIWPVHFYENKYISRLLMGTFFTKDDMDQIKDFMCQAIEISNCSPVPDGGMSKQVGVLVVDPVPGKVIARAHSWKAAYDKPHHSAIMVAIDLVAKSQGGGVYDFASGDLHFTDCKEMVAEKTGPYLCTGYDIYVTHEPDLMDAMALVHSRIRRLFYLVKEPDGALGSLYKLHTQSGLNHHYEVFYVHSTFRK